MQLSDFDYVLPKELIAQYPLEERDSAKLLVLDRKQGTIEHRIFRDIVDYLGKDELIVLNDTKVLASRIIGSRITGGKVEILLLNRKEGLTFNALIKPSRVKIKEKIVLNGNGIGAEVSDKNEITFYGIEIDTVYKLGKMPLPPYIKRAPQDADNVYYQTVYAKKEGAIASPTAGLHFTEGLLGKIKSGGINIAYITLHVGHSTFKPVKSLDVASHRMDKEYFQISECSQGMIEGAHRAGKRIFAVGTTSARALESYTSGAIEGFTDLFIYPGYKFKVVDCLLTNFHLPRTTLFMLVSAFAQEKLIKRAYQEAIDRSYRFYSYGDAMLII
jgi:S-adenosylmethionine:tRNA ribosyltransferase-isomerase